MTSSHTQSSQKSSFRRNVFILLLQNDDLRSDSASKIVKDRADQHARKIKVVFLLSNSNQSILSNNFRSVDLAAVIELFSQKRREHVQLLSFDEQISFAQKFESSWELDQITRRRMSYIREVKLDAINYALIVKNRVDRSISRYMTSKRLNITIQMLKNWINKQHDIEISRKDTRKIRLIFRDRKFTMKSEFIELFIEIRDQDRRINKRWFVYTIKSIYQRLYSKRISRDHESRFQYRDFKFSLSWFMKYRRRNDVAVKRSTKINQKIDDLEKISLFVWYMLTFQCHSLDFCEISWTHRLLITIQSSQFSISFKSNFFAWRVSISIVSYR